MRQTCGKMDAEHVPRLGVAVQVPAPDFKHIGVPRVLTQCKEGGKVCVQLRGLFQQRLIRVGRNLQMVRSKVYRWSIWLTILQPSVVVAEIMKI